MANISGTIKSIRDIMWQDTGLNGDAQRIEQLGWMLFLKIFSDKDKELELLDDSYTSPIPDEFHWVKAKGNWAGDDEGMTGDELLEFVDRKLFPALRNLDVSTGNRRALIVREVFEGNNNYMKSGINIRKVLNKLNEIDFNIAKDRHAFGELYEGILKELQSAGKSGEFYTPRAITQFITDIINPQLGEKILDPACGTGGYLTCAIEHLKKQANSVDERKSIEENIMGWEYKPLPYLLATTNLILHDIEVPNIRFGDALDQPLSNFSEKHRVNVILANPPFGGIVANNNENNFPQNFRTKESADLFLILMIHLLKQGGRAGIVLPDGSLTGEGVKQRVRQRLLEECNLHTIIRLPNSVFQPYATVATNLLFFDKGTPTKEVWYYEHRLPEGQKSYSKTKTIQVKEFEPIKAWWNHRAESNISWKVPIETIKARGYNLDIKNPNQKTKEGKSLTIILASQQNALTVLKSSQDELIQHIKRLNCKEEVELLVQYIDTFIQNPKFIPYLKSFFLGLAVKGSLIGQNPSDEPATILLQKIKAEKARLVKEKMIKKNRDLPEINSEEIPFEVPEGWIWCRLGEICSKIGSGSTPKGSNYSKHGIPFFRSQNVYDEGLVYHDITLISAEVHTQMAGTIVYANDILLNITGGSMGRCALVPNEFEEGNVSQHVCIIRPVGVVNSFYHQVIRSPFFQKLIFSSTTGAGREGLPKYNLEQFLIPLPPLAEQHRIVQKLEQLMQVCDTLQASIQESRGYNEQLLQQVLREALKGE